MLSKLAIENLRGIRSGEIDDLRPLNIFVGKNGQGKSTILEAAYLLASAPRVSALHKVLVRRGWYGPTSWQYLVPAGSSPVRTSKLTGVHTQTTHVVEATIGTSFDSKLLASARQEGMTPIAQLSVRRAPGSHQAMVGDNGQLSTPTVLGETDTLFSAQTFLDLDSFFEKGFVERLVSNATVGGWLGDAVGFAKRIVPAVEDLRLVQVDQRTVAMLYFGSGRPSVPLHVAGDGIRRIVELSLAVLGGPPGFVAAEEPENFLHPGARRVCIEVLWAAANRGEQLFVSTHSLELLDELLDLRADRPEELEKVAVYNVALDAGVLRVRRYSGGDARAAREILGEDLRS